MPNRNPPPIPLFWTNHVEPEGTRLTYAVRGGVKQGVLVALGAALLAGGLYAIYWLFAGSGELTVAGYVFLLVPAGVATFGVYVLDIALLARSSYLMDALTLTAARESLFVNKRVQIGRSAIDHLHQQYAPPGESAPSGDPGSWTTFVAYTKPGEKKLRELPIDGLCSEGEARWLGPLIATWAGVKLQRGFGPAFEEADVSELPDVPQEP